MQCHSALVISVHVPVRSISVDVSTPSFAARGIGLSLSLDGTAELRVAELSVAGRHWRRLRVHCAHFEMSTVQLVCQRAQLDTARDLPFDFSYAFASRHLELDLSARHGERWRLAGDFGATGWQVQARLQHAQVKRLAGLLPDGLPLPTQGGLDGTLAVRGNGAVVQRAQGRLQADGLAFSDASGLHAADKLAATVQFDAIRHGRRWDWRGSFDWAGGEVFWQVVEVTGVCTAGSVALSLLRGLRVAVLDTKRPIEGFTLHKVKVVHGSLKTGARVHCAVDREKRLATMRNHPATHLLHAALRDLLGSHVKPVIGLFDIAYFRIDIDRA